MRILIVDDSALVRSIVKHVLGTEKGFIVAGEASTGKQAVEMNRKLKPDFIIMDINMPVMDGLEATRRIMQDKPVPILIFSGASDTDTSYKAIDTGAVDMMEKPNMDQFNEPAFYRSFLQKIRLLADKKVFSKPVVPALKSKPVEKESISQAPVIREKKILSESESVEKKKTYKMLVIGASTGGPSAVKEVLQNLPGTFPFGIALVQHIEKGFDQGYARWLNEATALNVRLAEKTEIIQAGEVLVAPSDKHLIIKGNRFMLYDGPKVLNQKPSVDVLFESAANSFGDKLIGVLLTGMGRDGANGCLSIFSKGGFTLVQDKETSAIFGMPKAAIDRGGASKVLPLREIPKYLVELVISH
ncbi:chemotaxis-specific protein-glutamate methyltransferase CheB [Desulfococcaceae bacterium HSG8]|nr:chemotaxis-specific protein-glutamate methyltransferase CheB [Desulfococcaceae bacterium HSG8]